MSKPYHFRGIHEYIDAATAGHGDPAAVALARSSPAIAPVANHIANVATLAARADPAAIVAAESPEGPLAHADRAATALELVARAARAAVEDVRAHLQTRRKDLGMARKKTDTPDDARPDLPTEQDPVAQAKAGPLPADAEGKPIDLSVDPEFNPAPETSDIGRLKEGKETFGQTEAENAADPAVTDPPDDDRDDDRKHRRKRR